MNDGIEIDQQTLISVLDRCDIADCWVWQGALTKGYGAKRNPNGSNYVHRQVWELLVGSIPEGMEIHHMCENPPCCNPDHLKVVTHQENMGFNNRHMKKMVRCKSGRHLMSEQRKSNGHSGCRACANEKSLAWYHRTKGTK